MTQAIRFIKDEFSAEQLAMHNLAITGDEVRVYFAKPHAVLPIFLNGRNILLPWGNRENPSLPRTGFCKLESLQAGKWQWLKPEPVNILASSALTNGVWFQVKQGIQGLIIKNPAGHELCYMLTQTSTHYFRTMTGAERMPVLTNQVL